MFDTTLSSMTLLGTALALILFICSTHSQQCQCAGGDRSEWDSRWTLRGPLGHGLLPGYALRPASNWCLAISYSSLSHHLMDLVGNATEYSPEYIAYGLDTASHGNCVSEDCLTINIIRSRGSGEDLPILVSSQKYRLG